MKKELIKLLDGAIVDIDVSEEFYAGCETCDYGREYVTRLEFNYKTRNYDLIRCSDEYEYLLSMSDILKVILNSLEELEKLRENEVGEFIKEKLENDFGYEDLKLINDEYYE